MHTKCPFCNKVIVILDEGAGLAKCEHCSLTFNRTGTTIDDARQYMLKKLSDFESAGIHYVRWSTANDGHVCPFCKDRNKRLYTIKDARRVVEEKFCYAEEFWQGCRCILLAEIDPKYNIETKQKRKVKVIYNTKTELRNGKPATIIKLDLKIKKGLIARLKKIFLKKDF